MTQRIAWVPYKDAEAARQALGQMPENVTLECFANADEPPSDPANVNFLVLPYQSGTRGLSRVDEMTSLEVVQAPSAGVDGIAELVPDGVTLCNAGGVHDAATAELAITLALASGRSMDRYARQQVSGEWDPIWGSGLADLDVVIVGYGNIGKAIERRLAGFETASITRVARTARDEQGVDGSSVHVHAFDELPELLEDADVVFIIAPLTDETRGLFGADMLAKMPDGSLLVNVGRGPIVDTDALLAETSSGRIRAALDVTDPEPLPAGHPLRQVESVLISPHVGGLTNAFQPRLDSLIRRQLLHWAAGEALENQVG